MHIIIAAITALAGLLWAINSLQRSGFSLSSVNPFLAYRRWKWSRTYGAKPIYRLERPMDVAAVLLLGTAKADGAITSDQKRELQSLFHCRSAARKLTFDPRRNISGRSSGQDSGAERAEVRTLRGELVAEHDATGGGGGLERFLDEEVLRYRDQLHRYARLMKLFRPEQPVRAALYFPLMKQWREVIVA